MPELRSDKLTKSYNRRVVVKEVNVKIRSGEIVGFLGRNGAGKTTTFQMMVGLIKPDRGNVFLDDKNISLLPSHLRAEAGITYLPQENSVFLKASVKNNLKLVLELLPLKRKEREEIAGKLLEELGLQELAKQSAHSLSGGERRRLEISRSLILNPKFLLLDEPFTGIDPLTIIELQKIILKLKEKGIGIILSDHNVRDTLKVADHAFIIDEGEILIEGSPREISSDEKAKEKFLGKSFKLGDEVERFYS
ncbi:MAG: LPS export ABC transporter ATP-binding protein [Candidatus Aminicenantes bacterium]|nr:LPS export ABC transporter ATP-binding protein [Candidatus Aminicenantes bacterium]